MASTPHAGRNDRRDGRRHIVGPLILLLAGMVLLLNNLQVLPWSIWREIWPYWPAVLILLGVEALLTGRVAWGTLVLLVILAPLLGLAVSAGDLAAHWHTATREHGGPAASVFNQPLENASSALLEVQYGAGALVIGPLPPELQESVLADGQVYGHEGIRFETRSTQRDGRRTIRISPEDMGPNFDLGRLELRVSPTVPTDLKIESGVTEMTLDLERLRVPNLSLETGASKTTLILPAQGQTNAQIEGGAANINVTVPPNVAARIIVDGGPNRISVDEARFPRQDREYRSPNYESATDRVTLRIEVGASRVTVQ
ncbi:MAG: DUF5668 domain-containing protein [Chloroflexota bacterium]